MGPLCPKCAIEWYEEGKKIADISYLASIPIEEIQCDNCRETTWCTLREWRKPHAVLSRTKQELKDYAKDIIAGHIFTTRHMSKSDMQFVSSVFMPLGFLGSDFETEEIWKEYLSHIGTIMAYYKDSAYMGINGMPMFMSMLVINKEDSKFMWEHVKKLQDALKAVESEDHDEETVNPTGEHHGKKSDVETQSPREEETTSSQTER